jgi:nicotinamide-nucleotide amidase
MDAEMDLNLIMSVAAELKNSGKQIAVAESLTSGLIQHHLGSVSGSSQYFLGGLTCYSMESKIRILGVPEEFVLDNEAVNPDVAVAMAQNVAKLFNADIGIGTTGFAEPSPLTPTPYAFFCVALPDRPCHAEKVVGANLARNEMRTKVAEQALLTLVETLCP